MKVHVDLCLIPIGGDSSISADIAECQRVFSECGLTYYLHAYGTNVEGEWDEVMGAIKACHERVHSLGRTRISSTLKIGTRTDRAQRLQDKISSVMDKLR